MKTSGKKIDTLSDIRRAIESFEWPSDPDEQVRPLQFKLMIAAAIERWKQDFADKSAKEKAYIEKRILRAVDKEDCPRRQLMLLSILIRAEPAYRHIVRAFHILRNADISIAEAYGSWHSLYILRFLAYLDLSEIVRAKYDRQLRLLYRQIVLSAREEAKNKRLLDKPFPENDRRIVLVISEYLRNNHPLAAQAHQYAEVFHREFGHEVMIVNASMPPRLPMSLILDPSTPPYPQSLEETEYLDFDGTRCRFAQMPLPYVDLAAIEWMATKIRDFQPWGVFTIGTGNLLVDALAEHVPVAALPNTLELPYSEATLLSAAVELSALTRHVLRPLDIGPDKYRLIGLSFKLPATSGDFERNEFGIPEDALVFVIVGTRLMDELSGEFQNALLKIKHRVPKAVFLLIGHFKQQEWDAPNDLRRACYSIGYQRDILAALALADAYLNPSRQGGATSAAFAMAKGLPVIALETGDVGFVAGPDFHQADLDAMVDEAARLSKDEAYLEERRRAARARWEILSDIKRAAGTMLSVLDEAAERISAQRTAA